MKHLKTPQELKEASENLNISDVSDSELFTLQDIKDAVTMAFRWGKTLEWGETPEKFDEEEKTLFNEIIKELRLRKSE
jgi:hypothetical protein